MIIKRVTSLGLAALAALAGSGAAGASQEALPSASSIQPISWEGWQAAKANAEKRDAEGDFVAALQYYLEYARQAEGLKSPVRVAWGKNNAAYMIIKMFRQDPTVDLVPAEKLLEEALAVPEVPEGCRAVVTSNLAFVKGTLGRGH
jgi:hypothetical protein